MNSLFANKMKVFAIFIVASFTISVFYTNCSKGGFMAQDVLSQGSTNLSSSTDPKDIKVNFSSTPQAFVAADSVTFNFDVAGQNADKVTLECYLNTVQQSACKSPVVLSGLEDKEYNFEIIAKNQNGFVLAQEKRSFRVDKTAPTLTLNQVPGAQIGTTSTNITFSSSDNFSFVMVYCAVDSETYNACSSPMALASLATGAHTVKMFAQDRSGNKSALQTVSFSVVLGIPTVTLSQTPAAFSKANSASFSFSATSTNSTISSYECSIDNGAFSACTSPKSYTALVEGSHSFAVRAKDALGQTSSPAGYSFAVDLTKPTTPVVSSNLMNPSKATSLSLTFSSTDASGVASYECKADSGAFAACSSPQGYMNLTSASHTFTVRATDKAGNVSSDGTYTIVIDTAVPVLAITAKPDAMTTALTASFTFSASDALSGLNLVECQLDNQAYASCTSPKSYTVAAGAHTFNLRASDKAGNSATQTVSWTVVAATPAPTPAPTPDPCLTPSTPSRVGLLRLTSRQMENTLKDLLTINVTLPAEYPRDEFAGGYVSLPETQLMSSQFVEQHMDWMFALSQQVVNQSVAGVISCEYKTGSGAATCADKIISDFMLKAFRRPVLAAEKTYFMNQYNTFSGTAQEKMSVVLASILSSPNFVYREITNPPAGKTNYRALTSYELASRLSYFVWESMPDAQLFAKAQSGELSQPAVLKSELKRMLASSRIDGLAKSLVDQWFGYSSIWKHTLSAAAFPNYTAAMKQSMYNETTTFVKYLIQQNRPLGELVSANYTFADSNLAGIYGVTLPANSAMTMVNLTNSPRQGILGHAGLLSITAAGEKTSIVKRGLFANDKIFCTTFGAPPPGVDTSLPTTLPPDATAREIMEVHRANPQCASCHNYIDPPGLLLEKFDPIGRYRTSYTTGRAIDTSTKLVNGTAFTEPKDLNVYLSGDRGFGLCVVKRIVPIAANRLTKFEDQCSINTVTEGKIPMDITFAQLLENIVTNMMFTMQAGE